jgi:hypothetical protein
MDTAELMFYLNFHLKTENYFHPKEKHQSGQMVTEVNFKQNLA